MIRTIKQRIYLVGLLPLALLTLALVLLNGVTRIDEAHKELQNAQQVTAALLKVPAIEALVVGNAIGFEQSVGDVMRTSRSLLCVMLRDERGRVISKSGICATSRARFSYFELSAPSTGFSDLNESSGLVTATGELALLMDDESLQRKRRNVIAQLALSVTLVLVVLTLTGRLLRRRVIKPILRIGEGMRALTERNYSVKVPVTGNDELSRLAQAMNETMTRVEQYTRELERLRNEADRALHLADEANLVRDDLVRSLTEHLEGPMNLMHSELTAIAIANEDVALREDIKNVIGLLQDAKADAADIVEIATSVKVTTQPNPKSLAEMLADLRRDFEFLIEQNGITVTFAGVQGLPTPAGPAAPPDIFLDLDIVRLRKALVYVIRALGRRSRNCVVHLSVGLVRIDADRLHLYAHLAAFYRLDPGSAGDFESPAGNRYGDIPRIARWGDRETKTIDYLLRTVGVTPVGAVSASGAASISLDAMCRYTTEQQQTPVVVDWTAVEPISLTLISDDTSLLRLTRRAVIANVEIRVIALADAMAGYVDLLQQQVLLIDICEDIGEAFALVEQLRAAGDATPCLVSICPPGRITVSLSNHLVDIGFSGVVQKPLQFSRIMEVVRTALSLPLQASGAGGRADRPGMP